MIYKIELSSWNLTIPPSMNILMVYGSINWSNLTIIIIYQDPCMLKKICFKYRFTRVFHNFSHECANHHVPQMPCHIFGTKTVWSHAGACSGFAEYENLLGGGPVGGQCGFGSLVHNSNKADVAWQSVGSHEETLGHDGIVTHGPTCASTKMYMFSMLRYI